MKKVFTTSLIAFALVFMGLSASAQVPNYVPTNGLVGWYPFTGNANDQSGNNNNATTSNVTLTNDRFGNPNSAYNFSGNNSSYIEIPSSASLGSDTATWSFWIQFNNATVVTGNGMGMMSKTANATTCEGATIYESGSLLYSQDFMCNPNDFSSDTVIVGDNSWHLVVFTIEPGNATQFYVDGIAQTPGTLDASFAFAANSVIRLGRPTDPYWQAYTGSMDDVGIWNRVLNPSEIQQLFTSNPCTAFSPVITANGNTTFCQGGSVTLDAGTWSSYLWSNGSTNETDTLSSTGTYTVTVTDGSGCTGTASQVVTVNPNPTPTISDNPAALCQGSSLTLNAGAYSSYLWSNGHTTEAISVTTANTYKVTVTNVNGCIGTTSQIVTVVQNPILTISGASATCQGDSILLLAGSFSSYLWNTGATADSIYAQTAGTYSVTVSNSSGCTGTASKTITLYPLPIVSFSGLPSSVCSNAGVFALTGSPTGGNFSGSGVANANFNPNTLSGSYNISYTYTDPTHGCHNTAVNTVDVLPFTNVTITPSAPTSFCSGDSISLSVGPYQSYLWNTGATTSSIYASVSGTYMVTATAANGCSGTSSKTVTVYALPTVSFSGLPSSVCSNAGSITLTGSPAGGNFSGSGITNSNFNPATLSGSYNITYSYTDPTHGCHNTAVNSVVVNPFTNVVITPSGATSFCTGDSITLNAGVYASYIWNTSATTGIVTASAAGTYIVTATAANGCSGTASVTITLYALPTVSFTGLPSTICANAGAVALIGNPTGGHFSGAGVTNSDFNPATLSGNHTVTYTYISTAHGCSNSSSQIVTVNTFPTVVITPSSATTFCQGDSITLSTGAYQSYLWNTSSTTSSIIATVSGSYMVTAIDVDGCTGTASVTITVNTAPSVSFSGLPASVCADAGLIALTGTPTGGHFSGTGVTNNDFNPNNLNGTYSVTYTYINSSTGCSASATHSIIVNPFTNVVIASSSGDTICQGNSVTFSVGVYASYIWSSNATTSSITVNASGTYTVTVTSANGCTGTSSAAVFVVPLPTVNFSGLPATICSSAGNILLTGSPAGGIFFGSGISGNNFNPLNVVAGNDTITYFYQNASGCSNSTTHITDVTSLNPVITSSGPTVLCQGDSVTLDAGIYTTYLWNTGATTEHITISTVGSATYTVTVTAGSCTGTASQVVTINTTTPVTFSGLPASMCSNAGIVTLTGSPSGGNFSGAGINGNTFNPQNLSSSEVITYTYNNPNGCTSSSTNTVIVTNVSPIMMVTGSSNFCANHTATLTPGAYTSYIWSNGATTASITVNTTGDYIVTVTGGAGCTGTSSEQITVYPLPNVSFTGLPATVCSDAAPIQLTGSPAGGAFSGQGVTGTEFNPFNLSGNYTVTYTYVEPVHGCSNTSTNSITVNTFTPLTITPSSATTFCQPNTVTLSTGVYASYIWSNGATTSSITVSSTSEYIVTATAANGCTGTDSIIITANALPSVSFTGLPATLCSTAGNITLSGTPTGGAFNGPGINGNTFNPQNVSTGNDTITYYYTDTTTGCVNSIQHIVGVSNVISTISANAALAFCPGDSVSLTASANTSYSWSNSATTQSITVNATDIYTVTVTGLYGCTSTNADTVTVYTTTAITFTVSPTTICSNAAAITLSATPVSGLYSGNGVTNNHFNPHNLSGAEVITYTYIDSLTGCSSSAQSTITINAFPTLTITLSNGNAFCQGGSQIMTVNGSFASYSWSTGATTNTITATTQGTYTVTATAANGCSGTKFDSITVYPLPTVSFTGLPTGPICNEWVTYPLTGTPSGGYYQGSGISGNIFNPYGQNTQTDDITYFYTDAQGCTGTAVDTVRVNNCTGIPIIQISNGVELFPNPNNGSFSIAYNMTQPDATLNIHDVTGRLVASINIDGMVGNQQINTELSEGIYFWEVINAKGIEAKGKISILK